MFDHRYRVNLGNTTTKVIPVRHTEDGGLLYRLASDTGVRADFRDTKVRKTFNWYRVDNEEKIIQRSHGFQEPVETTA